MKFLLDANLSPETAEFLRRRFSFDVISVMETKQAHLADPDIASLAERESRIIITHDLDFGMLYHESEWSFGAIILRIGDQRIESVNSILEQFLESSGGMEIFRQNPNALVILDESSSRVRKEK